MAFCKWNTQGQVGCVESFVSKAPVTYSFNVFLYDEEDSIVSRHVLTNLNPNTVELIMSSYPKNMSIIGKPVRVEFTDMTLYTPYMNPLKLIVQENNGMFYYVGFGVVPVGKLNYRTVNLDLKSYNGFSIYFDKSI